MISLPYNLTRRAEGDIASIEAYTINQWGIAQAKRYLAMLETQIFAAASMPELGGDCNNLSAGCRSMKAGEHVIFYCVHKNHLQVLRVLHKRMDASRHFH